MSKLRSVIRGCGSYLPNRILTNRELESLTDTTDEWIRQRTGIHERRIVAEGEFTSDLAYKACVNALDDAGMKPSDVDLIIVATATPDHTFPATATQVQNKLGIEHGAAFDVQAVCSGFVFALATADKFLQSGSHKCALVVGAETFSRILDWKDRTTCVLFGDGAGALLLEAEEAAGDNHIDRGVLSTPIRSNGRFKEMLYVDGGPSLNQQVGYLRMQGKEVFRNAVNFLSEVVQTSLEETGISADEVDWFVPHQANRRIIEAMAKKLKLSSEKVVMTIDKHANTSAASIPLALRDALDKNKIKKGDLVLMEAMGGGFTWGAALVRW